MRHALELHEPLAVEGWNLQWLIRYSPISPSPL